MKQVQLIQENVHLVDLDGKKIYLVGTAHVSRASAELVERTIHEVAPDTICVELCAPRMESLKNSEAWRNTDIFKVIKDGKGYVLMAQIVLSSFQKRLAKQFGVQPGEEMRTAIRCAEERGARLEVVDREIRTTLKRAWSRAGIFGFAKIVAGGVESLFNKEEITEKEIEDLKQGDALAAVMSEFSAALPGVKTALIDERDLYMAEKIRLAPGDKVLAVLGAGHIPGILKSIGEPIDIAALSTLPKKSSWGKFGVWLFPALLVALLVYGFYSSGKETSLKMFGAWALSNMFGAALGGVVSLAHPLTILVAFITAPFAAIHPLIAVGWLCALTEALVRKPRVIDFENISDDLVSLRGLWKNRVSKIFLILILTNLGSVIGSVIGMTLAVKLLG